MEEMNSKDKLMTAVELAVLPCAKTDFARMRKQGFIYVDKTEQIFNLACQSNYFFLSRPRRFGKTLLISTFEDLFKNGLENFKGLAIEKLWTDHTYPVIHLDFSGCKTDDIDEFKNLYTKMIEDAFALADLPLPSASDSSSTINSRVEFFIKSSKDLYPVILIDEYDAPLNNALHDEKLFSEIRKELSFFYSMLKRVSGQLRFLFFTGICKYKNLSIFSDTNYVTDISMDAKYGTLLGYTDDEVRKYFTPFVENAAKVLGINSDECFDKLKLNYDGFCFDDKASTHVYTPWSVLSFLSAPEKGFRNYWYSSGGQSSLLLNYISGHALRDITEYGQDQYLSFEELDSSREVNDLNDYALLYQTGYLTIKDSSTSGDFVLNYPNAEVATSMARLYADELFKAQKTYKKLNMNALKLFSTALIDDIPQKLNEALTCIDYNRFPIVDEASLEAFLVIYAYGGGVDARPQGHNAYGRSDIEFSAGNRYFVFELKYLPEGKDYLAVSKLTEAVEQIKNKHYDEDHAHGRELVRLALVYSRDQKKFIAALTI